MYVELALANVLKLKARTAIKGLGFPKNITQAVLKAIDSVSMPLGKYYKLDNNAIKQAFITQVLGGVNNIDDKYKGEIEQCLIKKL